jgi:hypothetical protein
MTYSVAGDRYSSDAGDKAEQFQWQHPWWYPQVIEMTSNISGQTLKAGVHPEVLRTMVVSILGRHSFQPVVSEKMAAKTQATASNRDAAKTATLVKWDMAGLQKTHKLVGRAERQRVACIHRAHFEVFHVFFVNHL